VNLILKFFGVGLVMICLENNHHFVNREILGVDYCIFYSIFRLNFVINVFFVILNRVSAPFTSVTVKSAGSRLGSLVFFLNRYRSGGPIINNQISTHIE
jgi:hypothetical protein